MWWVWEPKLSQVAFGDPFLAAAVQKEGRAWDLQPPFLTGLALTSSPDTFLSSSFL